MNEEVSSDPDSPDGAPLELFHRVSLQILSPEHFSGHLTEEIMRLVPYRMQPLCGGLVGGMEQYFQDERASDPGEACYQVVPFQNPAPQGSKDCEMDGLAGAKLGFLYALTQNPRALELFFSGAPPSEIERLCELLYAQYGETSTFTVIGSADRVVEELRTLMESHYSASAMAFYDGQRQANLPAYDGSLEYALDEPDVSADGFLPSALADTSRMVDAFSSTHERYLSILRGAAPFPGFLALDQGLFTPEKLQQRADLLSVLSHDAGPEPPPEEPVPSHPMISEYMDDERKDLPFDHWHDFIHHLLDLERVDIRPARDRLMSWDPKLTEHLIASNCLSEERLADPYRVLLEDINDLGRRWHLSSAELRLLVEFLNNRDPAQADRYESLIGKINEQSRLARAGEDEKTWASPREKPFQASGIAVPIFNLEPQDAAFGTLMSVVEHVVATAGVDVRPIEQRFQEWDPNFYRRLHEDGYLDLTVLNRMDRVPRAELDRFEEEPWSLSVTERDTLCDLLNGRADGSARFRDFLWDIFQNYRSLLGHPAMVVCDVHRNREMDEASLRFLERMRNEPRVANQPLLITAVAFPDERGAVGMDILESRLGQAFGRNDFCSMDAVEEMEHWSGVMGQQGDYQASLGALQRMVQRTCGPDMDLVELVGELAGYRAEGRPPFIEGSVPLYALAGLFPGFLEQAQAAARDNHVEASQFSLEVVEGLSRYLEHAMAEDGFNYDEFLVGMIGLQNDQRFAALIDCYVARWLTDRSEAPQIIPMINEALKRYLLMIGAHVFIGRTEDHFFDLFDRLDEADELEKIFQYSPVAASPAAIYALAQRFYHDGKYEQVLSLVDRIYYGHSSSPYEILYRNRISRAESAAYDSEHNRVEGYLPVLSFDPRFTLEILRVGLMSAGRILIDQANPARLEAIARGEKIGEPFDRFNEANDQYESLSRQFKGIQRMEQVRPSPYAAHNAALAQGEVESKVSRNFSRARFYYQQAREALLDSDGNVLPGKDELLARVDHLDAAELSRDRIDQFFEILFETNPGKEISSDDIYEVLESSLRAVVTESRLVADLDRYPTRQKIEYSVSYLQACAYYVALHTCLEEADAFNPDIHDYMGFRFDDVFHGDMGGELRRASALAMPIAQENIAAASWWAPWFEEEIVHCIQRLAAYSGSPILREITAEWELAIQSISESTD